MSSHPSSQESFDNITYVITIWYHRNRKDSLTISLFSTLCVLQGLAASTIFDDCKGIQNTNEMGVRCPNHY